MEKKNNTTFELQKKLALSNCIGVPLWLTNNLSSLSEIDFFRTIKIIPQQLLKDKIPLRDLFLRICQGNMNYDVMLLKTYLQLVNDEYDKPYKYNGISTLVRIHYRGVIFLVLLRSRYVYFLKRMLSGDAYAEDIILSALDDVKSTNELEILDDKNVFINEPFHLLQDIYINTMNS